MILINELDVNTLHLTYNGVLSEISNSFNNESKIFRMLTGIHYLQTDLPLTCAKRIMDVQIKICA